VATEESAAAVHRSWQVLRARGAATVYPGHGPPRAAPWASPGIDPAFAETDLGAGGWTFA